MSTWVLLALLGVLLVNIPQIQGRNLGKRDEKGADSEDAEEKADESDDYNTKTAKTNAGDKRKIITRHKRGMFGSMMGGGGMGGFGQHGGNQGGTQGFLFGGAGGHGGHGGQSGHGGGMNGMPDDILGTMKEGVENTGKQFGKMFGGIMTGGRGNQAGDMFGGLVSQLTRGK